MDIFGTHLDLQEIVALSIVAITLVIFCILTIRKARSKSCGGGADCACSKLQKPKVAPKQTKG